MKKIDESQIKVISKLIYREFGISINQNKFSRLELRLEKMLESEKYTGFDELYELLVSENSECLTKLASYVTTCHTFFFREEEHFQSLVSFIRQQPQKEYLIWCAASSTGEEPYSVAMTLLNEGITNFHIIASDLNRSVLQEFNRGIYHESRFVQTLPVIRYRYFKSVGDSYYAINRDLRSYISIKQLNLMDPFYFPEPADFVFCRNVFIYFDENSCRKALDTITQNMKIGGTLFIGHAEILLQQPDNLKKTGSSIYRRIF